jgi:hypothetical protein
MMSDRIPIRFDRTLRPEWLDFALEQSVRCSEKGSERRVLGEYLGPQIKGKEALKKTITQLQRVVGPISPLTRERLCADHERMGQLAPDARTPIRLALLMQSSPFFDDCVAAIRRMSLLSAGGFTAGQLNERLVAKYGDRAIVPRSTQHVLQTLGLLGVVVNKDRRWNTTRLIENGGSG